jgi:hypothetical protein
MTPPEYPIVEADASELRRMFNDLRFAERAASGDLVVRVKPGSEHPAPSTSAEPAGSVSHILEYLERGVLVAKAHEHLRPEGAVGGSGLPDPKWLFIDGVIYKQRRRAQAT